VAKFLVDNLDALINRQAMREKMLGSGRFDRKVVDATVQSIRLLTHAALSSFKDQQKPQDIGGIDINPAFLKLLVKRDGKGIPIPTAKVPVKDTDIYGFEPVISSVEKVDDLPAFIGIEK